MEAISEKLNGMAIQSSNSSTNSAHRPNVTPSTVNTVLVTANVGSVFEDTKRLMPIWLNQFDIFLERTRPEFVALHCQEIGGKFASGQNEYVKTFSESIKEIGNKLGYTKMVAFFDEDFECEEKYTALGCIYLVHSSITDISMYNFKIKEFVPITESIIRYGSMDNAGIVEKQKFPLEYFPTNRWSRKGYLRTRWKIKQVEKGQENMEIEHAECTRKEREISGCDMSSNKIPTTFDLVNVHLFHDADNLTSLRTFPSLFAKCRERALKYTLDQINRKENTTSINDIFPVPFFIFGDFNFRLNAKKAVDTLMNDIKQSKENSPSRRTNQNCDKNKSCYSVQDIHSDGEDLILYKKQNLSEDIILSVGRKEFKLNKDQFNIFGEQWKVWKNCDFETVSIKDFVVEYPLSFPPTYPFEENLDLGDIGTQYMETRCPAWCDRILVSRLAERNLLSLHHNKSSFHGDEHDTESRSMLNLDEGIEYNVIGSDVCMGDHKPVYLKFSLKYGADDCQDAAMNINSALINSSYVEENHNEVPEKFPRIESPTYIDLLNNTDSLVRTNSKDLANRSKPIKNDTTSSSLSSSTAGATATTSIKHLGDNFSYKETTV